MAADATVFTITLAAQMLGQTEDRLWALADQMEPEDGVVWVYDTDNARLWPSHPSASKPLRN